MGSLLALALEILSRSRLALSFLRVLITLLLSSFRERLTKSTPPALQAHQDSFEVGDSQLSLPPQTTMSFGQSQQRSRVVFGELFRSAEPAQPLTPPHQLATCPSTTRRSSSSRCVLNARALLAPLDLSSPRRPSALSVPSSPSGAPRRLRPRPPPKLTLSPSLVFDHATGKPKGFGFCEYKDPETAASALRNLQGVEVGGRGLRLDFADTEDAPPSKRGGPMGGGGGPPRDMGRGGMGDVQPKQLPPGVPMAPGASSQDTISQTLATMPPGQLLDIMSQMKVRFSTLGCELEGGADLAMARRLSSRPLLSKLALSSLPTPSSPTPSSKQCS